MNREFYELVRKGRSVIFVNWRSGALALHHNLSHFVPSATTAMMQVGVERAVSMWRDSTWLRHDGVLVTHPRTLGHGVRLTADRIIWIGAIPHVDTPFYGDYVQSMARCDHLLNMCQRHHFTEQEAGIGPISFDPENH